MTASKIESILFVTGKPLSVKQLIKLLGLKKFEVEEALEQVRARHETQESGIRLIRTGDKVQIVTSPENTELVSSLTKEEIAGELTRPSLEALTIIAYRGPITKPEIEQIRGVNCSLILRNLMIRGLILEQETEDTLQPSYVISIEFLKNLGVSSVDDLPGYGELSANEQIETLLHGPAEQKEGSN